MLIAAALIELAVPDAETIKARRRVARSVKDRIRQRFNVSVAEVADLPDGEIDLVFVCTPASTNPGLLRQAADKGIRAAFIASAGYGEAGDEGIKAQDELVDLAAELEMLVVGPNGQGVVSTPADLCAQIVAPYPPRGRISVVSQSGNFVSSFENYARASGVGIARAVSCGNAAQVGVPLPGIEYGIATSAVLLGAAVMLELRPPLVVAALLVGFFAIFHGHAHGTELPPGLAHYIPVTWNPASTISTSPVMPFDASPSRNAAASPTSAASTFRLTGARSG